MPIRRTFIVNGAMRDEDSENVRRVGETQQTWTGMGEESAHVDGKVYLKTKKKILFV